MIMKHNFIIVRPVNRNIRLLIFGIIISTMFVLKGMPDVWSMSSETPKVVFMSKRDGNAEIYTMNPDGSEQVNLTEHPAGDYDPVWSPNGKQILFSSDRDGIFDLYLMDADGNNVQKVFKTSKYRRDPSWSPDGKHIVFAQGEPEKARPTALQGALFVPNKDTTIYMATINGNSAEKLVDGFKPAWSPDGREIAYVIGSNKGTPLGIFNLQTQTHRTLLSKKKPWMVWPTWWITSPKWSPQGDKISFAKLDEGAFDKRGFLLYKKSTIYIVNRDGTGLRQISKADEEFPYNATWSPNGNQLIYNALIKKQDSVSIQLFKTDLSDGNLIQLTHEGSNSMSNWFTPTSLIISP